MLKIKNIICHNRLILNNSDLRRRDLQRLQNFAFALLLAALAGLVLSALMGGQGIWAWTLAFSEAAVVGALADWFAVVALFRRPLGLPFPHTAIIPSNKARIGDQLALFVRDHFLEPGVLLQKLAVFDPAARLAQWLGEPQQVQAWANAARAWGLQAHNTAWPMSAACKALT